MDEESIPHDGWKRRRDNPRRVAAATSVTTSLILVVLTSFVGSVSNLQINFDSNTRWKECPQEPQGTGFRDRMQDRKVHPQSGGKPEKPAITLEGVGYRGSQLLLH